MLGLEFYGPFMLFGDNNLVILNTTIPSSQLKRKHYAIAYHRIPEGVAAEICFFVNVDLVANLADFLMKPPGAVASWRVVKQVLFKATIWVDQDVKQTIEKG